MWNDITTWFDLLTLLLSIAVLFTVIWRGRNTQHRFQLLERERDELQRKLSVVNGQNERLYEEYTTLLKTRGKTYIKSDK